MDDFRYHGSQLLIALEAANTRLLFLLSARAVGTSAWDEAVADHSAVYSQWAEFLLTQPKAPVHDQEILNALSAPSLSGEDRSDWK